MLLGPTPSWLPPLAWLARFVIGYSVLLLLVPLLRWRNRSIAVRNARRQSRAWAAGEPSPQRQQLRAFARRFAPLNQDAGMGAATIVYDSVIDLLEQSIEDLRDTSSPEGDSSTGAPPGLSPAVAEEDRR